MKLSVIVPGIRPQNWEELYFSVGLPMSDFEMIFVGPESPKVFGSWFYASKYIKSFRSPNAAQQQGLMAATGDYITFAADDGIFLPGALDHAFELLNIINALTPSEEPSYKRIVIGKYLEGDTPHPDMLKEDYYRFKYHKAYRIPGVPQENLIFNCGIISRKFMLDLGGWDAQNFECTTMAHADLGIRAFKAGAEMILMDKVMFKCSHEPRQTGTHGPIHRAQTRRDEPTFKRIYSNPKVYADRIKIPLDNWEKTPEIWSERFGK